MTKSHTNYLRSILCVSSSIHVNFMMCIQQILTKNRSTKTETSVRKKMNLFLEKDVEWFFFYFMCASL